MRVALVWLWCGFRVALGWLYTPEYMPSICLLYGFAVALGGFHASFARSTRLRQSLAQGGHVLLGCAFGLQVLELRMGENGLLHSRRARCFIEVLHCARRAGN